MKKKNTLKKSLIFRGMELSIPKLKKRLNFRNELTGPENQTKNLPEEISCLFWRFCNLYSI